jgi:L,D-transpeptidase ErfK/SrfK
MKKLFALTAFLIIFFTDILLLGRVCEAKAQGLTFKSVEIASTDFDIRACVAQIPPDGRLYTVGGIVCSDAVLIKGALRAGLEDFGAGDRAKAGWGKSRTGRKTESLAAMGLPPGAKAEKTATSPVESALLGTPQRHVIQNKETLLDIARQYNLGFNEMQDLYPHLDPWIPPVGVELVIPSQRLLPDLKTEGIVINLAEFRLYYFMKGKNPVLTFPVGLGNKDWPTPVGKFRIGEKRKNPTWYIPPSLQHKYPVKAIPPGPDNPLGKYWMGLEGTYYGIHGTDIPWSIGRLVTHGCIRMYPEDIPQLFKLVKPGTEVRIIYEPVKIGRVSGRVYVEVHRDIYNRIEDLTAYGYKRLGQKGLLESVDLDKFRQALDLQDGLPWDITL